GISRLALLALPQQAKHLRKRMAENRELVLLSQGLLLFKSLPDALTERIFRECFLPEGTPLPRARDAFEKLLDSRRAELSEVADRLIALVATMLKSWRAIRVTLEELRSPTFAASVRDIEAQPDGLLPPDFLESTPRPWLEQLPRFFKAIARRLERLPGNVQRDMELARQVRPFAEARRELASQPAAAGARPELERLRWMIEEFRVSLHAQDLK